MKKKFTILLIVIVIFSLTACSSGSNGEDLSQTEQLSEEQGRAANLDMNSLIVGLIKLEETDMLVTQEQAKTLLPYWKILKSLLDSGTAAEDEIQSILDDIRSELTDEQLVFIIEMDFDTTNLRDIFNELGIEFGRGGSGQVPSDTERTEVGGFVPGQSGGGGGGGIPGQGGGTSGDLTPEQQETREAMIAERGGSSGSSSPLIQAIITLLESKE